MILSIEERNLTREDRVNVKESIVKIIIELLNRVIDEANVDLNDIEFIGIASPGTISDNIIKQATNLGLEKFDLIAELQKYINLPMQIKNDSKCAALAEKHYGAMRDYDDGVFLCIGTGIGGAAFINGQMLVPKRFSGFEFGHMVINKGGRQCSCGKRGCFENYASMKALKEKIKKEYTESDLKEKVLAESGGNILSWFYEDYDGNGCLYGACKVCTDTDCVTGIWCGYFTVENVEI